ncbi:ribosomal protein L6, alpha-beta domain-containing protein [Aspergillus pseudonomiae]|uniref:Ribosomal protein L6, alpha-beta domain-containing protein n=1 Tax=Aspergillus pseudonomiae TaxID=1506151 RepID=A0A5N6I0D7_9EURO|nr:ribosomal protein L6, alpha-beta domain-containing protein [Aspergillus pseudonomiae]KAB8259604.1 ribosomal protein L6, alpha-beta domain-containing protein [Aspergillus pseudonomiae]KAE8398594.1 ribosomal protein L6, alpha-beta domain-containing protein [Aspergillus pseudonomiae]
MTVPKDRNNPERQDQESGTDERVEAKTELNIANFTPSLCTCRPVAEICARCAVIVFSKSYCPHSARAKSILLDKYSIVPAPYVVELDQHALGQPLQALLAENTGRRTVPNVLVSGRSIGGGDEVAALDEKDELASTLKTMGGQWVQEGWKLFDQGNLLSEALRVASTRASEMLHITSLKRRTTRDFHSTKESDRLPLRNFDPFERPTARRHRQFSLGHSTAHAVKMRYIHSEERLPIPENVKVHIRSRVVTVEGPRGKLVKDLSHIAVTFGRPEKDVISIEMHHGARKGVAALRTVRTLINNLIIGVTKGFKYKMRYVYAHFPINVNIEKNAETGLYEVEIRNFLGEKYVRRITAQAGVEVATSANVKDELVLSGNSLEGVSQSAADIQQICRVRNKDIRKFLDGLYVSERGNIIEE